MSTAATNLDLSRWRSAPRGVQYRRWVIISAGLRQLYRLRFFKIILGLAWSAGLAIALLSFAYGQFVTEGGWLETLASQWGSRSTAVAKATGAVILMYPDICVGGFYTLVFWLHSYVALWFSLFALTALLPRLITRDRASNALIAYLARPLTSGDYLLGKLGTIVGVLLCVWTGPLLFGWLLGLFFAPNLDFVIYSGRSLLDALLFNGVAIVSLSAIALGVSAVSRTTRNTLLLWLGLWLILGFLTIDPGNRKSAWFKRASFTENLAEARIGILDPSSALLSAAATLPISNKEFSASLERKGHDVKSTDFHGALYSLGGFVLLSSVVFLRRIKPE